MYNKYFITIMAIFLFVLLLSCGKDNPVIDTTVVNPLGYDSIVMPVPTNCRVDSVVIKDTTYTFTIHSLLPGMDSVQYDSTIDTVQGCFRVTWDSVKVKKKSPTSRIDTIVPVSQYSIFIYDGRGDLVRALRSPVTHLFVGGLLPNDTYTLDVASIDSIIVDTIGTIYFVSKRSAQVSIPIYLPIAPRDIRVHCTATTAQVSWSAVPGGSTILGYTAYLRDESYSLVDSLYVPAMSRASAIFRVQPDRAYKVNVVTVGTIGKSEICSTYVYDRSAVSDTGFRLPYVYMSSYVTPDESQAGSSILGAGNMVGVHGGIFTMGTIWQDTLADNTNNNKPAHEVIVSSFFLGRAEISNAVFLQYINDGTVSGQITHDSVIVVDTVGSVPVYDTLFSFYQNADTILNAAPYRVDSTGRFVVVDTLKQFPVTGVSWQGAIQFCNWLSMQDNLIPCYDTATGVLDTSAGGYRLPTEAEFEYVHSAAFIGTKQRYPWGYKDDPKKYGSQATGLKKIGSFAPYFGFYDVTGNALEWCHDWGDGVVASDTGYYSLSRGAGVVKNPLGPVDGSVHVLRGGSYRHEGKANMSAYRHLVPGFGYIGCGFRVARKYQ